MRETVDSCKNLQAPDQETARVTTLISPSQSARCLPNLFMSRDEVRASTSRRRYKNRQSCQSFSSPNQPSSACTMKGKRSTLFVLFPLLLLDKIFHFVFPLLRWPFVSTSSTCVRSINRDFVRISGETTMHDDAEKCRHQWNLHLVQCLVSCWACHRAS